MYSVLASWRVLSIPGSTSVASVWFGSVWFGPLLLSDSVDARRDPSCLFRVQKNFDAVIFGCYEASQLRYVGRTRNGFTPSSREQLFRRFRGLEMAECPFANLPEARSGRWGEGLTADKMKECRWLRPVLVAQFEYVEWTPDNHPRHASFIALREDRDAREVRRDDIPADAEERNLRN
jgi:ATP-dependent DNA ligase